jgi:hypothetical protein
MVEFEFEAGANNSAEFNSTSNNVPNNAMIHQAVNGISSQPSYLEAVLGGRNSGLDEDSREDLNLNNDNTAVELSPAMENLRMDKGSIGDHLHISSHLQKRKKMRKINLFLRFVSFETLVTLLHSLLMIQEIRLR